MRKNKPPRINQIAQEVYKTEMAGTLNRRKLMLERFAQQDSNSSSLPSSAPSGRALGIPTPVYQR